MVWYIVGVIIGGMWSVYWLELDAIRCHLNDIKKFLKENGGKE